MSKKKLKNYKETLKERFWANKIVVWVKANPREFLILVAILLLAAFLRLFRIDEYLTFLGDEGRDVIVVRRLLVNFDPILVGPGTSIGNMYLGPLYYYLIAPALYFANYSPAGPAIFIALLGVATVFFVWFVAREWFGKVAAVVASALFAVSPTVIVYSRSSWNPNIMPFFALLSVYAIWRMWHKNELKWLIVAVISFAATLQSHYLGLLLAPLLGFYWLITYIKNKKSETFRPRFIKYTLVSAGLFALMMSPLVIFDARHGWRNFSAMRDFFVKRQTTVSARPWNALPKLPEIAEEVSTRLVGARDEKVGGWVLAVLSIPSLFFLLNRYRLKENEVSGYTIILLWIATGLVGLGLYKQQVYDHYYGFMFAAPFLLIGGFADGAMQNLRKSGKMVVWLVLAALFIFNLKQNPLLEPPNRQMQRSIEVAEKITKEAGGEPFNIAVIAERNYEGAYWYFLEKDGAPIVGIDAQRADETITEQLFVICELPKDKCQPTSNPKAEIANFGWSKIDEEWEVAGITLFKLVHNDEL